MTPKQNIAVIESWKKVQPIASQVSQVFYDDLCEKHPSLKALLGEELSSARDQLVAYLNSLVETLVATDEVVIEDLAKHLRIGLAPEQFSDVGPALLTSLEIGLEKDFTATVKRAWTALNKLIVAAMAQQGAKGTPLNKGNKETMDTSATTDNELAVRLQGALDQSSTAFMMIDRDFIVTYVNQATMDLLSEHEATFQVKWPSFEADKDKLLAHVSTCFMKGQSIRESYYQMRQTCRGKQIFKLNI